MRLEPFPAEINIGVYVQSLQDAGRYDEVISILEKAITHVPNSEYAHLQLTQCYWLAGHKEKARAEAVEVLRIDPKFSIEKWLSLNPAKDRAKLKTFADAMREAGLPEE